MRLGPSLSRSPPVLRSASCTAPGRRAHTHHEARPVSSTGRPRRGHRADSRAAAPGGQHPRQQPGSTGRPSHAGTTSAGASPGHARMAASARPPGSTAATSRRTPGGGTSSSPAGGSWSTSARLGARSSSSSMPRSGARTSARAGRRSCARWCSPWTGQQAWSQGRPPLGSGRPVSARPGPSPGCWPGRATSGWLWSSSLPQVPSSSAPVTTAARPMPWSPAHRGGIRPIPRAHLNRRWTGLGMKVATSPYL